ncbi:MAG: EAL domain-containing protein [Pseudomonas sp.]|uniref:two-component system response regulator n=1 Tax=Pseudomonas sp. TaxID=306 RepID=UPI003242B059|tara:strand:- start:77 stop:1783 length:1707 start_codon:yes stop_codon:yes gene_type:complete
MRENGFTPVPVILIVDDQPNDVLLLQEAVADLGDIHIAHDGETALALANAHRPDLILLDIQMPGMNGFQLCKAIKATPRICDAAIVFVTAHTQTDYEILALEYGGIDFIQKPLSLPVVHAHARAHLALRAEANRLAYYDDLTALPNRALLRDRAEQTLQSARETGNQAALVLLDLDNFKGINDSIDHRMGDQILIEIARRLQRHCEVTDTLSRHSGDEFVLLIPELDHSEALGDRIDALLNVIAQPLEIDGHRLQLTCSAGISVYPGDGSTLDVLFRHAEAAMYQAKQNGRGRYRFFSHHLEVNARARHLLEVHLREALSSGVLTVVYQPRYDAVHGTSCGMEALVRWRRGDRLVSPAEFIPLAEETGLIIPVGKQVLLQACADARALQLAGQRMIVGVNISAVQFREESFLSMIKEVLLDTGLPGELLELEITEGVVAHDMERTHTLLTELKRMGVRIAIDDFGTGYSSLSYLKKLPIDVLKIDQSFIRDMLSDRSDAAIVEAIVRMGHALELELVAEGVESADQAEALLALGCELMQGYHYCRPMPFEQVRQQLSPPNARGDDQVC